jgi:hypothetical protein
MYPARVDIASAPCIPHRPIMPRTVLRFAHGFFALSSGLAIMQPVLADAHARVTSQSAQAASRCTSDWIVRSIVTRPAKDAYAGNVFLGSPSAALVRSGLYVVGKVQPRTDSGAGAPSTLLIGPDGRALPLPAGAERGQVFRIAVAEPDSIYLLWGVANSPGDTAQRPQSALPTEVWFTVRTRDKGWAAPTRVFTALRIGWDDAQVPEVVRDRQGAFQLAFTAEREWGRATLVRLTMRRGGSSVALPHSRSAAKAS